MGAEFQKKCFFLTSFWISQSGLILAEQVLKDVIIDSDHINRTRNAWVKTETIFKYGCVLIMTDRFMSIKPFYSDLPAA